MKKNRLFVLLVGTTNQYGNTAGGLRGAVGLGDSF